MRKLRELHIDRSNLVYMSNNEENIVDLIETIPSIEVSVLGRTLHVIA